MAHRLPLARRAYHFPSASSLSAWMSSTCSATRRLSRAFSSFMALYSLTVSTSAPPYCFCRRWMRHILSQGADGKPPPRPAPPRFRAGTLPACTTQPAAPQVLTDAPRPGKRWHESCLPHPALTVPRWHTCLARVLLTGCWHESCFRPRLAYFVLPARLARFL